MSNMNGMKVLAIVLIVGGGLALLYGGFSYTRSTSEANIGPISIEVQERERVNIPLWAGVVAVVAGGVLLLGPARKA
jgi:hypothetical protein